MLVKVWWATRFPLSPKSLRLERQGYYGLYVVPILPFVTTFTNLMEFIGLEWYKCSVRHNNCSLYDILGRFLFYILLPSLANDARMNDSSPDGESSINPLKKWSTD